MTTELSFLVELLLNHRLPKATREAVGARIKEVEEQRPLYGQMNPPPAHRAIQPQAVPAALQGQAPSTIAAMMRHPDLIAQMGATAAPPETPPEPAPVAVIAQTPAAAAAMQKRQEALSIQLSGKPLKGETGPRKW